MTRYRQGEGTVACKGAWLIVMILVLWGDTKFQEGKIEKKGGGRRMVY